MKLKLVLAAMQPITIGSSLAGNLRESHRYLYDVFLDGKNIGVFWRDESHTKFENNGHLDFDKNSAIWNYLNKHIEKVEGIVRQKTFTLPELIFMWI